MVLMVEKFGDKCFFFWSRYVLGKGVEVNNGCLDYSVGDEVYGNIYLLICEWDSILLGECKWEVKMSGIVLLRRNKYRDI